jgi:transposase
MGYRFYPPAAPLLFGYDPARDLPPDHLARFVDQVVEESAAPPRRPPGPGQRPFDPRLPIKVLILGYATGVRSSRRLQRLCEESLPYLFLTRGDTPSYRTLCRVRVEHPDLIEQVWVALFTVADAVGMERVGQIVLDSTKLRANASPEAVVKAAEYDPVRQEILRILAEAKQVDEREADAGFLGESRLGQTVDREQMRTILRRVRKQRAREKRRRREGSPADGTAEEAAEEAGATRRLVSPQMRQRLTAAVAALEEAATAGRKHLCLTDPDARMMGEGREKQVRECHSFEVAVDRGAGLLVAGQSCQEGNDNARLAELVAAAQEHEPEGVRAVDADSGYYRGDTVGELIAAGIDTCIPDSNTAGDLHRGQAIGTRRDQQRGQVAFEYDPAADSYRCPAGNELRRTQKRVHYGQAVTVYRAVRPCTGCGQAAACLRKAGAKHRTLKVGSYQTVLEAARQRFGEAEHQQRYQHRGEAVETVFGYVRGTLGYSRWLLRGAVRVACEARLLKMAYQIRKVHLRWAEG